MKVERRVQGITRKMEVTMVLEEEHTLTTVYWRASAAIEGIGGT